MTSEAGYDYRELAYDLYKEGNDLLNKLVEIRTSRNMTQEQLADDMNVSQAYISKIENGQAQLVTLLTNYALEVGARIRYTVEPAQQHPSGLRAIHESSQDSQFPYCVTKPDGSMSMSTGLIHIGYEIDQEDADSKIQPMIQNGLISDTSSDMTELTFSRSAALESILD
ncbi:helix-turn-helix transcriptional regulator [Bifidobacterium sp.]|jgi:transcriptional regulator with XRE-family HTH domain|uniref:helix-turn-helix transcriptional regulator n=1 Tax=Bifidobacterium sp. TaxID=41200 RepID=UPI0025BFC3CD|nr:helix-turn-helix transcriptional regulator [Bifidobacterium sp.]MCI1635223.1 helix-turn-helix domain-containing protein [Bifidobacterium sp.]